MRGIFHWWSRITNAPDWWFTQWAAAFLVLSVVGMVRDVRDVWPATGLAVTATFVAAGAIVRVLHDHWRRP